MWARFEEITDLSFYRTLIDVNYLGSVNCVHASLPHLKNSHFNEFVIELPGLAADCLEYLDTQGLIGGFDLSTWYPKKGNWLLVSFSDQTKSSEIELPAAHLAVWSASLVKEVTV